MQSPSRLPAGLPRRHAVEHGGALPCQQAGNRRVPRRPLQLHDLARANGISRAWPRKVCDAPGVDARCFGAWGMRLACRPMGMAVVSLQSSSQSTPSMASPPRATKATLVPERALMSSRGDGPGRLAHLPSVTRADAQDATYRARASPRDASNSRRDFGFEPDATHPAHAILPLLPRDRGSRRRGLGALLSPKVGYPSNSG